MPTTDQGDVVRLVGSAAKFNTARHSLGIYRSVNNTCRYSVPVSWSESPAALKTHIEYALAHVILEHGMLRVGIAGEDTADPAFVHVKTMDMQRMLEWKEYPNASVQPGGTQGEDDRLLRALEKCHEPLWEDLPRKPGWKVIVHDFSPHTSTSTATPGRKTLEISYLSHHAYADGKSGYVFHHSLLSALNRHPRPLSPPPELDPKTHILHLPQPPRLPPDLETLVPISLSWLFFLRTIFNSLIYPRLPAFLKPAPDPSTIPWTGGPVDPGTATCHLRLISVPPPHTARLLAACRAHGATLTGLLHALILCSLSRRTASSSRPPDDDDRDAPPPACFRATTPMSLAAFADPRYRHLFHADATIHCLVSAHETEFPSSLTSRFRATATPAPHQGKSGIVVLDDDEKNEKGKKKKERENQSENDTTTSLVWRTAAAVSADLRARVAALPRDDITPMLRHVGDWHAFFRSKFGGPRESSWAVSNIGSFAPADPTPGAASAPEAGPEATSGGGGGLFAIERSVFSQGAVPAGPAFHCKVAGVVGGGLSVVMGWQDGIVEGEVMEGLVGDLREWLRGLGGEEGEGEELG
ncbi:hypothetical protein F5Y15DRAFT_428532 [Xylariaceae sp. FL0016]|nr:hypothetical protein F5Y15DRAFT_428532 [Xylariaceae sp. FL0016]